MSRTASVLALAILLPSSALAGSEPVGEARSQEVDFVAVIDAEALPSVVAEALGLDRWDGPVVLAPIDGDPALPGIFIRYDADPEALGPLAAFPILGLLDAEAVALGLPVVLTDAIDVADVVALLDKSVDSVDAVVETAFLDPEFLAEMPQAISAADAVMSVPVGVSQGEVPLLQGKSVSLVDPDAVQEGLLDSVTPGAGEAPSAGLLCEGPLTTDYVCVVADSSEGGEWGNWVLWTLGGMPLPEPPAAAEEAAEEGQEEDAEDSKDEEDASGPEEEGGPVEEDAGDPEGMEGGEPSDPEDSGSPLPVLPLKSLPGGGPCKA